MSDEGDAEKGSVTLMTSDGKKNTKRNREIVWRRMTPKKSSVTLRISDEGGAEKNTKRYRKVSERKVLPGKSSVTLDNARQKWC